MIRIVRSVAISAAVLAACTGRRSSTSTGAGDFGRLIAQHAVDAVLWQATSAEAYRLQQQCFELARTRLDQNLQRPRGDMPLAVVVDVDETVLDNSRFELEGIATDATYDSARWTGWVGRAMATAIPGAVEFLTYARSRDCEIFYVTNRERHHRAATVANLMALGFPNADEAHVLCAVRDATGRLVTDKTERRTSIGFTYDIRLMVGDQLRDFSEEFNSRALDHGKPRVDAMRDTLAQYCILLPNPMYGTWRDAISGKGTDQAKYEAVEKFFATYGQP